MLFRFFRPVRPSAWDRSTICRRTPGTMGRVGVLPAGKDYRAENGGAAPSFRNLRSHTPEKQVPRRVENPDNQFPWKSESLGHPSPTHEGKGQPFFHRVAPNGIEQFLGEGWSEVRRDAGENRRVPIIYAGGSLLDEPGNGLKPLPQPYHVHGVPFTDERRASIALRIGSGSDGHAATSAASSGSATRLMSVIGCAPVSAPRSFKAPRFSVDSGRVRIPPAPFSGFIFLSRSEHVL